jgi:hypothetical protein
MDNVDNLDCLKAMGILRKYDPRLPATLGNCTGCYKLGPHGLMCKSCAIANASSQPNFFCCWFFYTHHSDESSKVLIHPFFIATMHLSSNHDVEMAGADLWGIPDTAENMGWFF